MPPLPFLALCTLTGHLLARLHDPRPEHAVADALAHDLGHTLEQNAGLRRELEAERATHRLTHAALVQTSQHNQALLQSRPKPAPTPGQGGFKSWGEVLGLDNLGTGERVREGMTLTELVATPLDREAGA